MNAVYLSLSRTSPRNARDSNNRIAFQPRRVRETIAARGISAYAWPLS